jgi:hypothetical protein
MSIRNNRYSDIICADAYDAVALFMNEVSD